jgi:hypothetical protein
MYVGLKMAYNKIDLGALHFGVQMACAKVPKYSGHDPSLTKTCQWHTSVGWMEVYYASEGKWIVFHGQGAFLDAIVKIVTNGFQIL